MKLKLYKPVMLLGLPLMCLLFGGCAIPRAIGMQFRLRDAAPIPAKSTLGKSEENTLLFQGDSDSATLKYLSPLSPTEIAVHYRKALAARGWVENKSAELSNSKTFLYVFKRRVPEGAPPNGWTVADEEFDVWINNPEDPVPPAGGSSVAITLRGRYIWDLPTDIATQVTTFVLEAMFSDYYVVVGPIVLWPF